MYRNATIIILEKVVARFLACEFRNECNRNPERDDTLGYKVVFDCIRDPI